MTTSRQKAAARRSVKKGSSELSTRQKNRMSAQTFAFPKKRKEPLNDARHVRNAVARFDQVEGVTEKERDNAWRRIRAAARKYGVHIEAKGWRSLMKGGRTGRSRKSSKSRR